METTNHHTVRNYAAMTIELEELKALFDKKAMPEAEYIEQRDKIMQDMNDYKYKKKFSLKNYLKTKNIHILKLILNIISSAFVLLGLIFTILPMESFSLATLFISIAIATISLAIYKEWKKKTYSKYLIIVAVVIALCATGKLIFIKNVVVKDKQFEKTKVESKKQDIKDLEGL